MTTTVSSNDTTELKSYWWMLILPGLVGAIISIAIVAVSVFVFGNTLMATLSAVPLPAIVVLGLLLVTAPTAVGVGVHLDRQYVNRVSEWGPHREYILLGIGLLVGIGIPFGLLYLYRRHQYVGTP